MLPLSPWRRGAAEAAAEASGGAAARRSRPKKASRSPTLLTIQRCGTCHTKDAKGNLSRISWIRTTPEGWEEAIKRMVRLNGVKLEPADAKAILKYLSNYHGLAPEEAKPVMYMAEHRIMDETIPNESRARHLHELPRAGPRVPMAAAARGMVAAGRHASALYQQAEAAFRRTSPAAAEQPRQARAVDARDAAATAAAEAHSLTANPAAAAAATVSLDATLDFLAKTYPLHTPEWGAWRARMRAPRIAGKWLISAHVPGHGKYYGEMTIAPGAAEDEFTTTRQTAAGGRRTGHHPHRQGLVYAGYSWRGRSKGGAVPANAPPDDLANPMREALWISPDQTTAEGRWFWGEYQEFGVDVKMRAGHGRADVSGLDRYSLKTGSQAQRVRVFGANLPAQIPVADLDFGSGITVKSIASHNANEICGGWWMWPPMPCRARATWPSAMPCWRAPWRSTTRSITSRCCPKLRWPAWAATRSSHPRGYQQLEVMAYNRGADDKPHTADDVELGPMDANWSVEEFYASFGDDDKEFVGTLGHNGLFTPNTDGPNPQRKFSRNNYGDVWVVATAKNEKDKDGKPLTGRSYLVVAVPTYIRWDQPEVGA